MSKITRDAKLAALQAKITQFVVTERARLTAEAVWLRVVQKTTGMSGVAAKGVGNLESEVTAEISDFLSG